MGAAGYVAGVDAGAKRADDDGGQQRGTADEQQREAGALAHCGREHAGGGGRPGVAKQMGEEKDDGDGSGAQDRRGGVLYDGAERADLDVEREDGEKTGDGEEHDGVGEQHDDVARQAARESGANGEDTAAACAGAEPVREVAAQEYAGETTDDEQRTGEEIGFCGAEVEGATARAQVDGDEGGGGRDGDVGQRLEDDTQSDGGDTQHRDDTGELISGGRSRPCPYGSRGGGRGGPGRVRIGERS